MCAALVFAAFLVSIETDDDDDDDDDNELAEHHEVDFTVFGGCCCCWNCDLCGSLVVCLDGSLVVCLDGSLVAFLDDFTDCSIRQEKRLEACNGILGTE